MHYATFRRVRYGKRNIPLKWREYRLIERVDVRVLNGPVGTRKEIAIWAKAKGVSMRGIKILERGA